MNITYMSINYNLTFATLTTFYLIYRKPKNQGKLLIITSNRNVGGPRLCKRFENLLNTSGLSNCIQTRETSDESYLQILFNRELGARLYRPGITFPRA